MKFVHIGIDKGYENISLEKLNNYGVYYTLDPSYRITKIKRFLYKIHTSHKINNIVRLPFKKIWKKIFLTQDIFNNINDNDEVCFIINRLSYDLIDVGTLNYLKKKYKNSYFVYYFFDKVSLRLEKMPDFFKRYDEYIDIYASYNPLDCEKYEKLELAPQKIYIYPNLQESNYEKECDVIFVGKNKNRLDKILPIFEFLTSQGFVCDFYITEVEQNEMKYQDKIKYNQRIDYMTVLRKTVKAKCILDISQDGSTGFSLRHDEAVSLNKNIITDNYRIMNSNYYNPNKVILLDNIQTEYYKIKNGEMWNNKDIYGPCYFYEWLEKKIKG